MPKKTTYPPVPTPVEKAIKQLMEEVSQRGGANIDGVLIHPSDLPTLGALITGKPLPLPTRNPKFDEELARNIERMRQQTTGGPLTRAHAEVMAKQQQQRTGYPTTLERQLEESLWAMQKGTLQATPEVIREHLPHLAGGETRIRRVYENTVVILCPCSVGLAFRRCPAMLADSWPAQQCEEEVPVVEAGNALCVLHR